MSDQTSVHLKLMREMGASSYDPTPPDQNLCFLKPEVRLSDRGHRAHSWLKWKTIHPDHHRRRWARAHDRRGDLRLKHLAADLDWDLPAASKVWGELEREGLARRDEAGRLWMCGKVTRTEERTESEENPHELFVQKLPEGLRLYFESLEKSVRDSAEARYFAAVRYTQQLEADAMAAARAAGHAVLDGVLNEIGYQGEKGHGRPRVSRELLLEVSVASSLDDYQQRLFVQNGNGHLHETENGSVHSAHPYPLSEGQSVKVSESESERPAPATEEPSPPPAPLTAETPSSKRKGEEVVEAFEQPFGRKLPAKDPLRAKIAALPATFEIPARSVVRFVD